MPFKEVASFYACILWKLSVELRAERLIAFAIISRYEKNIFQPQRLRLYGHVTHESNVWRSYVIKVQLEKALGEVRSLIALAVLWWHTDRSSSAASRRTHLSSLQRKHQVGTLICCQVRSCPQVVFLSACVFYNMRNWRATCKRYSLLYFPVKITEFVWNSSAFKNCRVLL